MAKTKLQITRRSFLKSSLIGALAASLSSCSAKPVLDELVRFGIPLPWYKKGEIELTYNYCDLCPWRCGIVVKSVNQSSIIDR